MFAFVELSRKIGASKNYTISDTYIQRNGENRLMRRKKLTRQMSQINEVGMPKKSSTDPSKNVLVARRDNTRGNNAETRSASRFGCLSACSRAPLAFL